MRYSNALRIALLAAFAAMQTLYAQLDTGSISGTVNTGLGFDDPHRRGLQNGSRRIP
jgi:hypothetical protein